MPGAKLSRSDRSLARVNITAGVSDLAYLKTSCITYLGLCRAPHEDLTGNNTTVSFLSILLNIDAQWTYGAIITSLLRQKDIGRLPACTDDRELVAMML